MSSLAPVNRGDLVGRGELTDKAWRPIESVPPANGNAHRWRDHRQVIKAIAGRLHNGALWRDLAERHGPWKNRP